MDDVNDGVKEIVARGRAAVKRLKTSTCTATRCFAEGIEGALRAVEQQPEDMALLLKDLDEAIDALNGGAA